MSSELDRVRAAQPSVVPPSDEVRLAARQRLLAAIADEPTELYANRHRPSVRSPRPKTRSRSFGAGLALVCSVVVVAAVVGAVVAFGHHGTGRSKPAHGNGRSRGAILASGGQVLAGTAHRHDLVIVRSELPRNSATRNALLDRLAQLLGQPIARPCPTSGQRINPVACTLSSLAARHEATVTIARDVTGSVQRKVRADAGRLRGVLVVSRTAVTHPSGMLANVILGVTSVEGHKQVGRTGLEAEYNAALSDGNRLTTTLNLPLERVAQQSLRHSIQINHASGGAFVAMNPDTGAIDAIGSLPGAHPDRAAFPTEEDGAVQAVGPTGSVFAPITALAAFQSGASKPNMIFDDTGRYCTGRGDSQQCRQNRGGASYGAIDGRAALKVQSDDYLYNLGARTNVNPHNHPEGGALQHWAAQLGIGRRTGIDLPDQITGTLPTPAWRQQRNQLEHECDTATGPFQGKSRHKPGGCGIADGTDRPWSVGDNETLAVGQGDLQVSPIQLAVAYAAIANGHTTVTPHIGAQITSPAGTVLDTIDPPAAGHPELAQRNLKPVQDGMRDSASEVGGTSNDVFGDLQQQIYGQVGSAQAIADGRITTSGWYAGYAPASTTSKPIVVIVWLPSGGFGDVSAAPVARQILSQWFNGQPGPYRPGTSTAG